RLDLALEAGGVHLGAKGLPVAAVRRLAPSDFLIACSTHDREEAVHAAREGADFLVFGPVFATPSKPGHPGVGLDVLSEVASAVEIPVLALGGMTPERLSSVAGAGAEGIAGISMFESGDSLRELVEKLDQLKS
ncbi:MAG: thiamine phosphate synthase, partial [Vicinamibacteria bacterium]